MDSNDDHKKPLFLCPRSNLAETAIMEGDRAAFATDDVVTYETVPHPELGQWADSFRLGLSVHSVSRLPDKYLSYQ